MIDFLFDVFGFLFNGILKGLVDFIFFAAILGTLGISVLAAALSKRRSGEDFP